LLQIFRYFEDSDEKFPRQNIFVRKIYEIVMIVKIIFSEKKLVLNFEDDELIALLMQCKTNYEYILEARANVHFDILKLDTSNQIDYNFP
jgi:hypothetical protein